MAQLEVRAKAREEQQARLEVPAITRKKPAPWILTKPKIQVRSRLD